MSEIDNEFACLNKLQLFKGDRVIGALNSSNFLFACLTMRPEPQNMSREMARLSVTNELDSIWKKKQSGSDFRQNTIETMKMASVLAEIQTLYVPNKSLASYRHSNPNLT